MAGCFSGAWICSTWKALFVKQQLVGSVFPENRKIPLQAGLSNKAPLPDLNHRPSDELTKIYSFSFYFMISILAFSPLTKHPPPSKAQKTKSKKCQGIPQ